MYLYKKDYFNVFLFARIKKNVFRTILFCVLHVLSFIHFVLLD